MGLRYGRPLPKSGADGTLVEASPAINLKYYGHAVEHSLSFGRNGSASSGGFVLLAKVRPLQFGRTEAPSTPPLPRSLQPDARKRVRRSRSVYRVRITGVDRAFDALSCDRSKI